MSEPKIVVGHIQPIKVKNLKWGRLFSENLDAPGVQIKVQADSDNPVTKEFMRNLPYATDKTLEELKTYIAMRDPECGSLSEKRDVDSWLSMIDAEIKFRRSERRDLFTTLGNFFTPTRDRK